MDNKTNETLIQLLVQELSCKSCSSQMSSPLVLCFFGHYECSRCIELSKDCSICSGRRNSSGNNFLDRLCFRTTLKCSFAKEGCLFSDRALEVAVHEKKCTFASEPLISNVKYDTVESGANTIQSSGFKNKDCVKTVEESLPKQRADIRKDLPGERLEDVIASALECPVCMTRILPPILECNNGHQICFECSFRTSNCPVCRDPSILQTNHFLGRIFERLEILCKNASIGCQIFKKGLCIVHHENLCEFTFRSCPLRRTVKCRWKGFKSDFVDHCRGKHADMISSEYESGWKLRGFKKQHRPRINLLYAHGVMFRCCWERYGFSVNYIKDEKDMWLYSFDLRIVKPGPDNVFMVYRGVCFPVRNFRNQSTAIFYKAKKNILDFCDIHGNLSFIIKINKSV